MLGGAGVLPMNMVRASFASSASWCLGASFVVAAVMLLWQLGQTPSSGKNAFPHCWHIFTFPAISTPHDGHVGALSLTSLPHSGQCIIIVFLSSFFLLWWKVVCHESAWHIFTPYTKSYYVLAVYCSSLRCRYFISRRECCPMNRLLST